MEDAIRHSHRANPSNARSGTNLFLSYNRADRDVLLRIRQHLQERGISVFYDSENLSPGLPWVPALSRALDEVRAVAIFIGKAGLGQWQMHEVSFSLDRQTHEKHFPVIPVLLPGANIEALGFLKLNTWIDLRDDVDNPTTLNTLARAASGDAFIENLSDTIAPFSSPPYRALRPFREVDASLFFGREAFARALYKKVLEHRLITVVGPSGSGKSSVVQAGLLPLLRCERPPSMTWDIVVFTPGQHPFQSMAAAFIPLWERDEPDIVDRVLKAGELGRRLAEGMPLTGAINQILNESSGTDRLLIVVDQFEELFASVDCPHFVKALLDVSRSAPVTVILTLRADFYSQAISLDRELSDLMETGIINLGPMKRDELREAIVRPAKSVSVYFQEGLVERILDHVEEQPGHLPLLEFTLTELWERKQGNQITSEQYNIIDGVKGAISKRADALLASLPAEQQQDALQMLTRLVRLTSAAKEDAHTRQRVRLSDLGEEVLPVVRSFTDARLLVTSRDDLTGEETVELAHEALIHAWGTLTSYLAGDRQFLLWRQRLNFKIDEWNYSGFDQGLLLTPTPLAEAVHFAETRADELNEIEHEFIYASERKVIKRRRWALGLISVTVLTLLIGSFWMMWKRSDTYQIQTVLSRGSRLAAASRTGADEEWLAALIYYGKNDEAFDLAAEQIQALAVITEALMKTGQIDEARKTADRVYTSASKAWADRESYPNSDARFEAFFAAAKAYASIGETDAAQSAINEALTGRDIDRLDIDKASALARLSVQIGHSKEFQNEVRKSSNENFRRFALRRVAEALARNGKVDEALDAARDNRASPSVYDLEGITRVLDTRALTDEVRGSLRSVVETSLSKDEIETSDKVVLRANAAQVLFRLDKKDEAERLIRDAVQIARDIEKEKWKPRSFAYSDIVDALLEFDKFDDAIIAYREITAQPTQMIAASKLALKLIEAGRTQEALSVASKVRAASFDYSNHVFAAIAIKTARAGNLEEALATVGNLLDTGGENKIVSADRVKEDALIGIAKAMARMRRYRSVLELMDQYPALKDQLTIYSAVLREYAKEQNPDLASLLEVKSDGEAIFPWLR